MSQRRPYWRMPNPNVDTTSEVPVRYAVVNTIHQEVLSANHKVIGEAFNSMNEGYTTAKGLVVVATQNDKILGEVRRNGAFKGTTVMLPDTIWDGAKHPFYAPQKDMWIGPRKKTEAEVQAEVMEVAEAFANDLDLEMLGSELNKNFIKTLDGALEKLNAREDKPARLKSMADQLKSMAKETQ